MNLKRVFAGVAAAATMLGGLALGATTANAADGDPTITINNAQPGHTYTPYLIANLTYAGSTKVDGKQVPMLDVATANDDANGALKAAITKAGLTIPDTDTWYQENPAAWLATQDADVLRKVADKLTVGNLVAAAIGQSVTGEDPDSLTFPLPQGWYAITDSNGKTAIVATTINGVPAGQNVVLSKNEHGQANITTVGSVNAKSGDKLVVIEDPSKSVDMADVSAGDTVTYTVNEHGQANITTVGSVNAKSGDKLVVIEDPSKSVDMADVSAGDTVTYTVTGKIPATADNYDTFGYRLVDTPGNDLTINTTGYTVTVDGESLPVGSYTFGVDKKNGVATLNITNVNAETLKDFALPGKTITLRYTAQVTGTIADSNIVDNSVQAFGSFATLGNSNGTEVQSNPVTAQSFTNDFTLKKVDASDNPLTGAKFIISKTVESTTYYGIYDTTSNTWNWTNKDKAKATRFMGDNASEVTFSNLAAGTYTITETQVPNGFAASFAKPFQITVTPTVDEKVTTSLDEGGDTFGLVTLTNNNSENPVITVKNVQNVTQLPLTGAAGITMLVVVALLIGGAAALIAVRSRSLKRQLNA